MILSFFVAKKIRRGRKQSGMLSLVSIISTLSIAVGIAALIIGLSTMNGFERELKERILSVIPHAELYAPDGRMTEWRTLLHDVEQQPDIVSAAPFIHFTGLLENGNKLKAVQIQGVDIEKETQMTVLPRYIANDRWKSFKEESNQIIIGSGLAEQLSVKEGDFISLLIAVPNDSTKFQQPKRVRLSIAGIMEFSGSLGNLVGIIPLSDAQKYLNLGDSVTGVKINVVDVYNTYSSLSNLLHNLNRPLYASSWENSYGYMYNDIQMVRQIMYLAMIIVIGVACFSIVSTLVIAVKNKQSDIAIFKTLGATNRLISQIFIFYGVISGMIGSMIGVLIGVLVSAWLPQIMSVIESIIGHSILNSNLYFIDFLPSEIYVTDVIIVCITSMLLTLIASYYPAYRACKIDPVKILNGH